MTNPDGEAMPELLPCPFCGSNDFVECYKDEDHNGWYVGCAAQMEGGCGFSSSCRFNTEKYAIEAWNTRADSPQPQTGEVYYALQKLKSYLFENGTPESRNDILIIERGLLGTPPQDGSGFIKVRVTAGEYFEGNKLMTVLVPDDYVVSVNAEVMISPASYEAGRK